MSFYAAGADMLRLFGEAEIASLTDRSGSDVLDPALLEDALQRAASEADSYLGQRYPLPLKFVGDAVPSVLTGKICDMARYHLTGGPVMETDPITERYKQALAWLRDIAAGKAALPVEKGTGAPGADGEAESGAVLISSGRRDWC